MPGRSGPLSSRRSRPAVLPAEAPEEGWEEILDPLWPVAKRVVLRRDRYTCARCGGYGEDPHHRVALQAGGRLDDPHRHDPQRLVTLCRECHMWVHAHPTDSRVAGWIVRTGDDPLAVPVQMRHGTALLTDDGRMVTTIPRLGR